MYTRISMSSEYYRRKSVSRRARARAERTRTRMQRTRAHGVLLGFGLRFLVAAAGSSGGDGRSGRQRGERVEEHELRVAGDGHHCRVGRVGREQRARARERVAARAEHFGRLAAHVVHCEYENGNEKVKMMTGE